jgi:short-subunit dehydrogenase
LKDEPIGTHMNSAGIMGSRHTPLQMNAAEFADIMRVNVLGPTLVKTAFLPICAQRRAPRRP